MNAYASVDDLAARWRPIGSDERVIIETLLEDASAEIDRWVDVDSIEDNRAALVPIIVCEMVKRAYRGEQNQTGVDFFQSPDQVSQFESLSPARRPQLTNREKAELGASSSKFGSWSM